MTLNMLIYYSTLDILYKCIILQLERYMWIIYSQAFEENNYFFRKLLSAHIFINEVFVQTINYYLHFNYRNRWLTWISLVYGLYKETKWIDR